MVCHIFSAQFLEQILQYYLLKKITHTKNENYIQNYRTGGRNRKVSEAYVKTGKSIKELETEMLNGQKLQGPITAEEVNFMLKNKGMEDK